MSVIDTLVYDRTQSDVDRVFVLKNKILTEGLSSLSEDEKTEYLAGMKGAYNYTDMNRVGLAVAYIAERMKSIPVELQRYREEMGVANDANYDMPYDPKAITVTAKSDWIMGDTPTQSQAKAYLGDISLLRKQIPLPENTPVVPRDMNYFTFSSANDIEKILSIVDAELTELKNQIYYNIDHTPGAFEYSGLFYSGEGGNTP